MVFFIHLSLFSLCIIISSIETIYSFFSNDSPLPMESPRSRKAVIVGAGPVGCLTAIALAKQGWNVEVYEGRPGTYICI